MAQSASPEPTQKESIRDIIKEMREEGWNAHDSYILREYADRLENVLKRTKR